MGAFYINFCLENIEYDGEFYSGKFSSPDAVVYCEVLYDYSGSVVKTKI